MTNKQIQFILAVALQIAIIFFIIIFKLAILAGGTEILLPINPVDPKDFLRGDYVTFQYDISNIYLDSRQSQLFKSGDTIYVVLQRERDNYGTVLNIQETKPTGQELFIKGKIEFIDLKSNEEISDFKSRAKVIDFNSRKQGLIYSKTDDLFSHAYVVYGIEQYFIPENQGDNSVFWNKQAAASVAIDSNGNAALKRLYVDNQPWP